MTRRRVLLFAGALALLGGAMGWWWQDRETTKALQESVPTHPAFTGIHVELRKRVETAERAVRDGPDRVAALAELAQLYHANGFTSEAVTCYRGLVRLEPKNPRWVHRLACIYAGLGELLPALTLWQRTLALEPTYAPARIRMGDVLLKLNRNDEAAATYRAVLERQPDQPHALAGLARLDIAAQRWSEAKARLEKAAAASQGKIGADLLATTYEHLGDSARALALRGRIKSSGAFHDVVDPWVDETMIDCYDVYRLTVAAGFADHAGDASTAKQLIERALRLAPENVPALYQSGVFALQRRDYDSARKSFEACTRIAPDFSDGWAQLMHVESVLGNTAAAERALAAGLRHCPDSAGLNIERANRLAAAGRNAEAIAALERTLQVRPTEAEVWVKLAQLYFSAERVNDGVAALQRALAAEPDHPTALTTLALHAIGSGDEKAAREWLGRIALQPRVPPEVAQGLAQEFRERFGRAP